MTRRILLAAALLAAPLPALAGYSGSTPGGGSVVMGGDASGTSDNAKVNKLGGVTPGGSCPTGQIPNGISATGAPINCVPTATGFPYRSGNWYMGMRSGTGSTLTLTAGTIACGPVMFWATVTPSQIAARVATAASSGSAMSIGIFANSSAERPTGTPLIQATGLAVTASTNRPASVSGVALAGFTKYWECAWSDGNPALGATGVSNAMMQVYGTDSYQDQASGSFAIVGYTAAVSGGYTASFPDVTSLSWTVNNTLAPALKFQF